MTQTETKKKNKVTVETINIKGKEYVPVFENVKRFNAEYPNGRLLFEKTIDDGTRIQFICKAYKNFDIDTYVKCAEAGVEYKADAEGYAEEVLGGKGVNQTSHIENCQTSSAGRALRFIFPSVEASDYELAVAGSNALNKKTATFAGEVKDNTHANHNPVSVSSNDTKTSDSASISSPNLAIVELQRLQKSMSNDDLLEVIQKAWQSLLLPYVITDLKQAKFRIEQLALADQKELANVLQLKN
jgi:hypothetical protein